MDPVREARGNLEIANLNRDISELSIEKKYCVGLAIAATTICVAAVAIGVFALLAILVPPVGVPVAFGVAIGSMVLAGIFIQYAVGASSERHRKRDRLEDLQQLMAHEATSRVTTPRARPEKPKKPSPIMPLDVASASLSTATKVLECPLTCDIPVEPVFFNGRMYDRKPLKVWLSQKATDPFTRKDVSNIRFYTFNTAKDSEPKCPITHKSFEKPYFSQETGYCYELSAIEALSFEERRELLNVHDKKSVTLHFWYDLDGSVEEDKKSLTLSLCD